MILTPDWPQRFAERLKAARGDRSGRDVSRSAGIVHELLRRYESASSLPGLPSARMLAIVLQTSLDELAGLGRCHTCQAIVDEAHAATHCDARWSAATVAEVSGALDDDADSVLWTLADRTRYSVPDLARDSCVADVDACLVRIAAEAQVRGLPPVFASSGAWVTVSQDFTDAARQARRAMMGA